MIRYLTCDDVLMIHNHILQQSGGLNGFRDFGALESAIAQPQMTFYGNELYPTVIDKAAILGFSIIMNYPFVDGNKRTGHAAMETFLVIHGLEITASVDEQESILLELASSSLTRDFFTQWLNTHIQPL